jgi:hypothetical protein
MPVWNSILAAAKTETTNECIVITSQSIEMSSEESNNR